MDITYKKVGDYYYEGKGVKQDYSKAVSWYTKASTYNNDYTAQLYLNKTQKINLFCKILPRLCIDDE